MTTSNVVDGMNLKVSSACAGDSACNEAHSSQTQIQCRPGGEKSLRILLDKIVIHRLFGDVPWPASCDDCLALQSFFLRYGLEEMVPGSPNSWRLTAVGEQYSADLLSVFMGTWEVSEVPYILIKHELMDDEEAESLWEPFWEGSMSEVEFERVMKARVREAYFKFHHRSFRDH